MIDLELSIRLLIALASAVFAGVVVVTREASGARLAAAAVGLAPLIAWIVAPQFLSVAELSLPVAVRRPAVLLVGVAILLRYLPLRTDRHGGRGTRLAPVAAAILFWTGVAVTSANWIVAVGALLPATASLTWTRATSGASSDAAPVPPADQQDTPQ
jgi:hypothetical protein